MIYVKMVEWEELWVRMGKALGLSEWQLRHLVRFSLAMGMDKQVSAKEILRVVEQRGG